MRLKSNVKRILLWILTAFLLICALSAFPSFATPLFLLSAVFTAPIPKVWNALRRRGLRNGVRAFLTAAIVIAGASAAPTRQASETRSPALIPVENSAEQTPIKTIPEETNAEAAASAYAWAFDSMGNHPNVLLSGGKLYCQDGLEILPSADSQIYTVVSSEKAWGIERPISYINVWEGQIICRDDETRHIHAYDMTTGERTDLLAVNAGEVFVSDGWIFYVDLGQGASVFRAALDGGEAITSVMRSTSAFAVNGNRIFYLANDQKLYSASLSHSGTIEGEPLVLANNTERFFLDDGIVIESGDTVFHISPDGADASFVYRSDNDTMRLVGTYNGEIFYQENGNLYSVGNEGNMLADSCLYYSCPVINSNDEMLLVTYSKASDSAGTQPERITSKLLRVSR